MSMSMRMNHEPSKDTKQNLGGKLELPADVSSLNLTATVKIFAGDVQDTDLRLRRARRCPPSGEELKLKPRRQALETPSEACVGEG
jgi:hypothetical protein